METKEVRRREPVYLELETGDWMVLTPYGVEHRNRVVLETPRDAANMIRWMREAMRRMSEPRERL